MRGRSKRVEVGVRVRLILCHMCTTKGSIEPDFGLKFLLGRTLVQLIPSNGYLL